MYIVVLYIVAHSYYCDNPNSYYRYRDSTYYNDNRFIIIIAQL